MKRLVTLLAFCLAICSCSELLEEEIEGTLYGRIEFQTVNDEYTVSEVDVNACSVENLCERWEHVEKIEVTAITYEIVYLFHAPGIDFVEMSGSLYHRDGTDWVWLADLGFLDISSWVGTPIGVYLAEGKGELLGRIIKNSQNLGFQWGGTTSDPLVMKVDFYVNIKATVGL